MNAKNSNKKLKIYLYIISLNLLFILMILKILLLNLQKLYNYTGFNLKQLEIILNSFTICQLVCKIENLALLFFNLVLLIISKRLFSKIKNKTFKSSSEIPIRIINLENKDSEAITFMVTYIVPLLFIDLGRWDEIIIGIVILFLVGVMSVKTDLYLSNPTLSLRGFNLYKAGVELNKREIGNYKTIISLVKLKEGDKVKYIKLSEDEYYIID